MTGKTKTFELQTLWQQRLDSETNVLVSPNDYFDLTKEMLAAGIPLQALEVVEEGCERWPDKLELLQMRGMVLARCGDTQAAASQLTEVVVRLRRESKPDLVLLEESVGVLARTEKDFALRSRLPHERLQHLERSADLYSEAYVATDGYWSGINLATLLTLLGRSDEAKEVANRVERQCLELIAPGTDSIKNRYWILATLGEVALNFRDWEAAEKWYRNATSIAVGRYGDIRTSQRHVELLLEYFRRDPSLSKKWLSIPAVAVFSGHLIDAPDRPKPRFPVEYETSVRNAIRRWIDANEVAIGFSSAASGGDILFQEAIQERGGESYIILPFSEEVFVKTSVALGTDSKWIDRFWQVIAGATGIIRTARDQTDQGQTAYIYANQIIAGSARIKSNQLSTDLFGLAVWDGEYGPPGGTSDAIRAWQELGISMTQVRLPKVSVVIGEDFPLSPVGSLEPRNLQMESASDEDDTCLMALLFADAVGFSRLSDREIRLFMSDYLGRVALLADKYRESIAVRETAGDGLYLAFRSIAAAGSCALDLSEMVEQTAWKSLGFDTCLRLRVALHAGPIILGHDPVTGLPKGVGAHVSRAARLEPKTPPGQVYASEAFAALAQLEVDVPFQCRYVKQLEWAKRYGTFPTYLLTRTNEHKDIEPTGGPKTT